MNVHKQIYSLLSLHHLHSAERSFAEIERFHKFVLVGIKFILLHTCNGHFYCQFRVYCLYNVAILYAETNRELRMNPDKCLCSLCQPGSVGILWKGSLYWYVVYGGLRLLYALNINTSLRITQRECRELKPIVLIIVLITHILS